MLLCKSLRRDGFSGQHSWAPTKMSKERVVPLKPLVRDVLREHQQTMEQLAIDDSYGLVLVAPTLYSNVYAHLSGPSARLKY